MSVYSNSHESIPQLQTGRTLRGETGPTLAALLLATMLSSAVAPAQNEHSVPSDLNEATVAQLQAQMASGRLSSEELTKYYLKRIAGIDQSGPGVNSVIELNPDALDIARAMDALRKRGTDQ